MEEEEEEGVMQMAQKETMRRLVDGNGTVGIGEEEHRVIGGAVTGVLRDAMVKLLRPK